MYFIILKNWTNICRCCIDRWTVSLIVVIKFNEVERTNVYFSMLSESCI